MTLRKRLSKLLNGLYLIIVVFFLMDAISSFEIKSQEIKSFCYLGLILLSPLVLTNTILRKINWKKKLATILLPIVSIIGILTIGPLEFLFSSAAWQTQTIHYQNIHSANKKIEYQMQDVGALGRNQRMVEVHYLTKLFMIVQPVEKDINPGPEWKKVDIEVNEAEMDIKLK